MISLSKRALCVSAIVSLSAVACKFVSSTTFSIDVPRNTTVFDVATDVNDTLVVARNDGIWFYKNGRYDGMSGWGDLAGNVVEKVADSTIAERLWVWLPAIRRVDGGDLTRVHFDRARNEMTEDDARLNLGDWRYINDFAVGDGERIYIAGVRKNGRSMLATCKISGDHCGDYTFQDHRTDTGEFIEEPVAITVDRSTDKVYVATQSERDNRNLLMSYTASLGLTGQAALEIPMVDSLTADAALVAAKTFTAQSETGKRAGLALKLYSVGGTDITETDSENLSWDVMISGYATRNSCGNLWSAGISGGDLKLTKHGVCMPSN